MKRNNAGRFVLIVLSFFLFANTGFAQNGKGSKKELEHKKKRINQEIREINSLLTETKASKKSSIGALVTINIKLEKRQELINTIQAQLYAIDREIKQKEQQVGYLTKSLEKLKKEYARMIVFAQRNQDAYSMLMFIFAADNFSQAYARLKYMQQYSEFRKKQALEIIGTQTELIAKLKQLSDQRREKGSLLGSQEEQRKLLKGEKEEQEQVLTELQKKESNLKTELEKKKQDAIELQAEIKRLIEAEIRRKAEAAAKAAAARLAAKKAKEAKAREEKRKKEKAMAAAKEKKTEEKKAGTSSEGSEEPEDVPELSDEAIALSNDFSSNRGKLPWPVAKGIICETYGEHEHPAIKGFVMFNNGLEICASKGMQARAVFEGEVTSIAVSPTGGKLVIIRHGEYLSVYCNLEEVLVKTGQKVTVKQPIGTVLYNEDEGKTSMNLQIWKGQKTMDPSGWLINAR